MSVSLWSPSGSLASCKIFRKTVQKVGSEKSVLLMDRQTENLKSYDQFIQFEYFLMAQDF